MNHRTLLLEPRPLAHDTARTSASGTCPDKQRVLFLNRSYWPCNEATGQLLTELCEDLADEFDVSVLAGQPNVNAGGNTFRRLGTEQHGGVRIRRVWNSRLSKSRLPLRAVNLLTFLASATAVSLVDRRPDVVVAQTDPPLLCLIGAMLQRRYKSRLVVYLQDLYPDLAIELGKLPDCWPVRRLREVMFGVYRRADRVIVLSRDMASRVIEAGVPADRVLVLPNWVDTTQIVPRKCDNTFRTAHGLDGHFVVMYSGNLGLCQRLDEVVEAAGHLAQRSDIRFLIIGDGANRPRLEREVRLRRLANVTLLPYQPKEQLAESLSAADLHLVPLDSRIASCLMPSKLYGILASGSASLVLAPEETELADIIRREQVGRVVAPGDSHRLAEAILWCADHRDALVTMGQRARRLAENKYDRSIQTHRFAQLLNKLTGESPSNDGC